MSRRKSNWFTTDFGVPPISVEALIPIYKDRSAVSLPTNSSERKQVPMVTGVLDYFPDALAAVAKVSRAGNDKHNPGEPLHHTRFRSTDHADSLLRHLVDRGKIDEDTGQRHSAEVAWRALALLQEEIEQDEGAPLPRGAVSAGPPAPLTEMRESKDRRTVSVTEAGVNR